VERTEYDDVSHALCATMGFFNKRMDAQGEKIWFSALRGYTPDAIKRALAEYTRRGRHAPKPIDILELLARQREAKQESEKKTYTPCPEHIRKAWMWFLSRMTQDSLFFDGLFGGQPDVDQQTEEQYLLTVNEQAKLYNTPDAIPDEFKLKEVWG
jgi:hypothetical protein